MTSSTSNSKAQGQALERAARSFLAFLVLGVIAVEWLAASRLPVQLGRHEVDRRVAQAERLPQAARWVFLSDSISYEALSGVGAPAGLVDLSSNQTIAVVGNYFLLSRLLLNLGAQAQDIERVVYAVSPKSLSEDLDSPLYLSTYFTSVFNRPDEIEQVRRWLQRPDLADAMAAASRRSSVAPPLSKRPGLIRDPLGKLLRHGKRKLKRASGSATGVSGQAMREIERQSAFEGFTSSQVTEVYLFRLAQLCEQRGIELVLISPPIAPSIRSAWEAGVYIEQFGRLRARLLAAHPGVRWIDPCPFEPGGDASFYDGVHLEQKAKDDWGRALLKLF